jgi:hypothetical protein
LYPQPIIIYKVGIKEDSNIKKKKSMFEVQKHVKRRKLIKLNKKININPNFEKIMLNEEKILKITIHKDKISIKKV